MSATLPFGAIPKLVDLVAKEFVDNGCPAKVFFGEEFVQYHQAPNRVVFAPNPKAGDVFTMPQQIRQPGTTRQTVDDWARTGAPNPYPIATRSVAMIAHIWARATEQSDPKLQRAADQAALDMLVNEVYRDLREVAAGNEKGFAGAQMTSLKDVKHGLYYQLLFRVEIPILEISFPPGFLTEKAFTYELAPADGQVAVQTLAPDGEGGFTPIEEVDFVATGS